MSVIVETCPQCGAPVRLQTSRCDYCQAEFIVTSLASLQCCAQAGVQKYIKHYKEALGREPESGELNLAMGICYLDLRMFDLADKYISRAAALTPENADVYYYRAVALVKGRKPRLLSLTEIKAVDENLAAAAQLNTARATCHYLRLIVRADYFQRNGLRLPPPPMAELLAEAQSLPCHPGELQKLLAHVPVPDGPALAFLPT